jgi:hypothetical protein
MGCAQWVDQRTVTQIVEKALGFATRTKRSAAIYSTATKSNHSNKAID